MRMQAWYELMRLARAARWCVYRMTIYPWNPGPMGALLEQFYLDMAKIEARK